MIVLQINAVNGIRSTGRTTLEIAEYLNNNGHEGYIAYSDGNSYYKGYKIGTTVDKKLHALFSRISGLQAYFSKNGTRYLLKYIDDIEPDVIHLSNLHGNFINLEMLLDYIAKKDIPTVLTLHDCWFYTGKCTHYTIDNCYKWKNKCGGCPRLKKDNKSWFFDRTGKMQKDKKGWFSKVPRLAVVGVSDWITDESKSSLLSSANIIKRIYNWVDLKTFKPVPTDKLRKKLMIENKFVILGVASGWSNTKGLDKFIDLANQLSEDIIILVGNIEQDIKLPKNIIHINETHKLDELVGYYSMADVFINLSLEESFGLVTAEALACGTPAIVLDSTANPELVGEGCGYVVNGQSLEDLILYIDKIKVNKKNYYSENCIKFAEDNFDKNDRVEEYLELYKNIMSE